MTEQGYFAAGAEPGDRDVCVARVVIGAAFALATGMLLAYVRRSYANVVFLDGIQLLPSVGDYFSGELTIGKLFIPYGEHRIPLYRLILIASAAVLHLNVFVDTALTAGASLATAGLLWAPFRRSVFPTLSPVATAAAFLPVLTMSVSLAAPPMIFMCTQFQLASVVVLLVGCLLCRSREPSGRTIATCALLIVVYFVLLSGGYFPGLLAALATVLVARWILERRTRWREWALLALSVASAAVYARTLMRDTAVGTTLGAKLVGVVADPWLTIRFFLGGLTASVIDIHSSERLGETGVLAVGTAVLAATAVALHLFVRSHMWRRTYLPLWMLGYSWGIMAAVRVGRGDGGWNWMMNEWYAFHLKFIPLAVFWIVLFAAAQRIAVRRTAGPCSEHSPAGPRASEWWQVLATREGAIGVTFAVFLAATWSYTNDLQWTRGVHVKRWVESRREALLSPEPMADVLLVSPVEAVAGRAILEKYRLNVFAGSLTKTGGWHDDGWIGPEAHLTIHSPARGEIHLAAHVSNEIFGSIYDKEFVVDLLVGGKIICSRHLVAPDFTGGSFTLDARIPAGRPTEVVIRSSKSFIPAQHAGFGDDSRELSLVVTAVSSR